MAFPATGTDAEADPRARHAPPRLVSSRNKKQHALVAEKDTSHKDFTDD
jgi:hypothetical protein